MVGGITWPIRHRGINSERLQQTTAHGHKLTPLSQELLPIYPRAAFEARSISLMLPDTLQNLENGYPDLPPGSLAIFYPEPYSVKQT